MKRVFALLTIIVLSLASAAAKVQQQPRPFTIDDLLKIRRVSDPQLSPDGRWIAYTIADTDKAANKRTTQIYLISTDGGEPREAYQRKAVFAFAALVARRETPRVCFGARRRISNLDHRACRNRNRLSQEDQQHINRRRRSRLVARRKVARVYLRSLSRVRLRRLQQTASRKGSRQQGQSKDRRPIVVPPLELVEGRQALSHFRGLD